MGSCSLDVEGLALMSRTPSSVDRMRATLARCADARQRYVAAPVFEATLPAAPFADDLYATPEVPVGFYAMDP